MSVTHPNRKCTCGYTRFRDRRTTSRQDVERWVLLDTGGFGSSPFGTDFGAGADGLWGLISAPLERVVLDVVCESCGRVRSTRDLGGIATFYSYVQAGFFYVIASDVEHAGCFSLRFTGPAGVFEHALVLTSDSPPAALIPEPSVTASTPPAGSLTADALLRAPLPEVDRSGDYSVELVDSCCGCSALLIDITLEAEPVILTPLDADLGGAPAPWLRGQNGVAPGGQPASGSRLSIPFDKCVVVHEYDARLASLPGDAGWSHQGTGASGNYALVEGGALRGATTATLPSWWQRTTTVPSSAGQVFSYAQICPQAAPTYSTPGSGLDFEARYATSLAAPYSGARFTFAGQDWRTTRLNLGADLLIGSNEPAGWTRMAAFDGFAANREQYWLDNFAASSTTLFNTDGSAGALDVISRFGDRLGTGITILIRNFVASYGGRFIRPMFSAFAQVTAPTLRLYLVADSNASVSKTARFKVRYGSALSSPYALPNQTAETTINFTSSNTVYEVPLTLSGLTASSPFWFTVERAWDHGDDLLSATVHLLQAVVRSA